MLIIGMLLDAHKIITRVRMRPVTRMMMDVVVWNKKN